MSTIIIHHGGCFDGVAGAWVCARWCRENDRAFTIHPSGYEDPPPDVKGKDVMIVDFSYKREVMEQVIADANSCIVMDHHKTAQAALEGLPNVFFDMNKSGAGLAWDVLFPKEGRPSLINHVEDRDLWRFQYATTAPVIAYMATLPLTVENFSVLMGMSMGSMVDKGMTILDYIKTFGEKLIETWSLRRIMGYDVPVINTPYMNSSDHVAILMERFPGHPFYAYFFLNGGKGWQFGLRSKGDFDVSEIAKRFGGGGHKNAAGFTVKELPWAIHDMMLRDRAISLS